MKKGYYPVEVGGDEHAPTYNHEAYFATYQEAVGYLEGHPYCSHIDYFDGKKWHDYYLECPKNDA